MKNNDEMVKSWIRLVKDPRTPADVLEKAAYWESLNTPKDFDIRFWVASNPNCHSSTLATLSLVKNLRVLVQVAGHRKLKEETAGKLLKSHLRQLRRSLASNSSIPIYVMKKLSKDYEDVRECLARNPALSPELIKTLAYEKNPKIRAALARNPSISIGAFRFLRKDKQTIVRAHLISNLALPYEILHSMAEDPEEIIRAGCLDRALDEYPNDLSFFEKLAEYGDSESGQKAREYLSTYRENMEKQKEARENGEEV
jgi:hypothetical protein